MTLTVWDTTYEGYRTYLLDGQPCYASAAAPPGHVLLQTADRQVLVRIEDLPDFGESLEIA